MTAVRQMCERQEVRMVVVCRRAKDKRDNVNL